MRFLHVGVGGFGRTWAKVLHADPDAEVVGLVDVDRRALDAACSTFGYDSSHRFESLGPALRQADPEAVVCCTPPAHHASVLVRAMKAGLHAITEKPLADTPRRCAQLERTARETGRHLVVSQNYRYRPEMWTLAQTVRDGAVGEIGQVTLNFPLGHRFGGFRAEMEHPLLIDMSIHHFDLIRFVTGLDPVSVRVESWNPSWSPFDGDASCLALFEMNNGARVVYNGSWSTQGDHCDWNGNWRIEGANGTVRYENGVITRHTVNEGLKTDTTEQVDLVPPPRPGQEYVLHDLIDAVTTGKPAGTDVADNVRSMGMVFAAVRSARTGRRVAVSA
jgi:predicted dehydrogenase